MPAINKFFNIGRPKDTIQPHEQQTDGSYASAILYDKSRAVGPIDMISSTDIPRVLPESFFSHGADQTSSFTLPDSLPLYQKALRSVSVPAALVPPLRKPIKLGMASSSIVVGGKASSRLALSDFHVLRTLGTGSFGRVRLMRSRHNEQYYAVKVLSKKELVRFKQVAHTNSEREILLQTVHPFIVNLWGTFQDEESLYMVMDYVPGGELFSLLQRMRTFEPRFARFYAAECLLAIAYLHDQQIVYRDLKLENILLDREGHIRLTDFGFAKRVTDRTWTVCGTPDYLAPEIIGLKGYTKAVDCWALGVLIYEMLAGFTPFEDPCLVRQYEKIIRCEYTFPPQFDEQVRDLLLGLLTADLTCRLGNLKRGCLDIIDHPWFSDIDFKLLIQRKIQPPFVPQLRWEGDTSHYDAYDEDEQPADLHSQQAPLGLDTLNLDPSHAYFTAF